MGTDIPISFEHTVIPTAEGECRASAGAHESPKSCRRTEEKDSPARWLGVYTAGVSTGRHDFA